LPALPEQKIGRLRPTKVQNPAVPRDQTKEKSALVDMYLSPIVCTIWVWSNIILSKSITRP